MHADPTWDTRDAAVLAMAKTSRWRYRARIATCIAVIIAAPTLPQPWMIALQAALGGMLLGARLERRWPAQNGTSDVVVVEIDAAADAIRKIVWVPGCAPDDPKTWSEITDDARAIWRVAARAALDATGRILAR